ncbi:KTSC domain-containing protein [Aeromonas salmonicida]|uniref:KTSC domain-containing protein n=1 Tax=Aeromonas salmonicida TaxID=645 RepID=UPI0038B87AD7
MKMVPVSSSNLRAVGYDSTSQTLHVAFHSSGVYEYSGVPALVHAGLMSAESHGSYFDAHIKKGPYRYRKIS